MWNSIKIYFKQISVIVWFLVILIFFDLSGLYEYLLKPTFGDIQMPIGYIVIIILFLSGIKAYHNLRIKKMSELLDFAPELKEDKIFRIFYNLYKEGKFLRDSATIRRQQWDENVIKEITTNCTKQFRINYFSSTGRDINYFTPLLDENYGKALHEIEDFLDKNYMYYIKNATNS